MVPFRARGTEHRVACRCDGGFKSRRGARSHPVGGIALLANSDREVMPLAFELVDAPKPVLLLANPPAVAHAMAYVGKYRTDRGRVSYH